MGDTFKVTELSQIGVVVEDLYSTIDNFWRLLGWGPWEVYEAMPPPPELKEYSIRGKEIPYSMRSGFYQLDNIQFELIQPLTGPSLYEEHLATKGEGLHHIACFNSIPDYETYEGHLENLKTKGLEVTMNGRLDDVWWSYFDTEPLLGGAIYETCYAGPAREGKTYEPGDNGIEPPDFEVTEATQIGIMVEDIYSAMDNYYNILGWGPWEVYTAAPPGLSKTKIGGEKVPYSMKLAVYQLENIQVELIEPMSGPTIYRDFIEEKGEGLHHFACYGPMSDMDILKRHQDELNKNGLKVTMSGDFYEDRYAYYDTELLLGGVIYETGYPGKVPEPDELYPPK